MKKRFLILSAAAVLLVSSAAGCASKTQPSTANAQNGAEGRTLPAAETTAAESADASGSGTAAGNTAAAADSGQTDTGTPAAGQQDAADQSTAAGAASAGAEAPQQAAADKAVHLHPLADTCDMSEFDEKLNDFRLHLTYPAVHLQEAEALAYPDLSDALEEWNLRMYKHASESRRDLLRSSEETYKQLDADTRDNEDMRYIYSRYEDATKAVILRADSAVFSIMTDYYGYAGGAHGYYSHDGITFESSTGKELALGDIVTDTDALLQALNTKLMSDYPDLDKDTVSDYLRQAADAEKTGKSILCWNLDQEGLLFYFNPYTLAAYAAGMQISRISFAEYPELFADKYTAAPDGFIVPLDSYGSSRFDIDGDGKDNLITVYGDSDSDNPYAYDQLNISVDGKTYTFHDYPKKNERDGEGFAGYWSYEITPYYARTSGGSFLLIFDLSDSDYEILSSYKLTDGRPVPCSVMGAGIPFAGWDENYSTRYALTDPARMELDSRLFVIGTMGGRRSYALDAQGHFIPNEPWYYVSGTMKLTLRQDAELSLVDEDGNFIEPIPLKKGEELLMYRTDGSDYVDFVHSAGDTTEIIRATITDKEWPRKVNGIPADDLFDGIFYAG